MSLSDWLNAYWNVTPESADVPAARCPVCRSDQAALTIPASPEVEARVCRDCAYEWSIPVGTSSHGLPLWGDIPAVRRDASGGAQGERR